MITPITKAQYWKSRKMKNTTVIFDGVERDHDAEKGGGGFHGLANPAVRE